MHRTVEMGGQFVVLGTGHADGGLRGLAGGQYRCAVPAVVRCSAALACACRAWPHSSPLHARRCTRTTLTLPRNSCFSRACSHAACTLLPAMLLAAAAHLLKVCVPLFLPPCLRLPHAHGRTPACAVPYCLRDNSDTQLRFTCSKFVSPALCPPACACRRDNPDVQMRFTYSEALAHQIFAAADMLLVPSLFEPCGLTQVGG